MNKEKLTDFITKCICLLQLNKKSQFSKQLMEVSDKIDKEIKGNEQLQKLFIDYQAYLVAHILDLKENPLNKDHINSLVESTHIEEDEE